MKTIKISEIMKALHINIVNFRPANGAIYTDNIIDQLIAKYGDFSYISRDYYFSDPAAIGHSFTRTEGMTDTEYFEFCDFYFHWRTFWNTERISNAQRLIEAMGIVYDPISNYDKKSDIITGQRVDGSTATTTPSGEKINERAESGSYKDTKSISGGDSNTRTFNNYQNTVENDVTTYENTNYRPDTKSTDTQTGSYTDSKTYNNYQEDNERTYTGHKITDTEKYNNHKTEVETENTKFSKTINTDTDTWSSYDHVYEHTSGNIGVTTAAQMLTAEQEMRVKTIAELFTREFVKEHLCIV